MAIIPELLSPRDTFWQSLDSLLLWRVLLFLLIVLNYKNLPLVFHARVVNAFRFALRSQRNVRSSPRQLFQPIITSSRAPLTELDYNIHKSNSTYFSDLDIARSHLVCTLFATGIEQARCTNASSAILGGNGKFGVCLGAVSCSFGKEVKPYQRYEMWTRVLSWDRKWIYIVTHFVCKTKASGSLSQEVKQPGRPLSGCEKVDENLIVASALSKCVFKKGSWTIPPETMLDVSGLLPTRPEFTSSKHTEPLPRSPLKRALLEDAVEMFFETAIKLDDIRLSIESYLSRAFRRTKSDRAASVVDSSSASRDEKANIITWENIECERRRGMEMANLLAGLGGLETEFRGTEKLATHNDL